MSNKCDQCRVFSSIDAISSSLESKEATIRLIAWLAEGGDSNLQEEQVIITKTRSCNCSQRGRTSMMILNEIRDACRPFFEALVDSGSSSSPRKQSPTRTKPTLQHQQSYDDAFPRLGGLGASKEPRKQTTGKRRVRPQVVQMPTSDMAGPLQGNLVHIESSDDPLLPYKVSASAVIASSSTATPKKSQATRVDVSAILSTPPSSKMSSEMRQSAETKNNEVIKDEALCNLINVYGTLIEACLVPSTLGELYLILSMMSLPDQAVVQNDASVRFASILSSSARCSFFGAHTLGRLTRIIKGLGTDFIKQLVLFTPLRSHLPDLAKEYELYLQASSSSVNVVSRTTVIPAANPSALLTRPFDEQRDSRHKFKTVREQRIYKNREETRDGFLYNLRSFINSRGKGFDNGEAERTEQRVQREARATVYALMDANVAWFCDFFCEMLLQIGLIAIEETDKELLFLASKDKLSKLHGRFFDTSGRRNTANKAVLRVESKKMASSTDPMLEAKQRFHRGHQEFFFLFLTSVDSHRVSQTLLGKLVDELKRRIDMDDYTNFSQQLKELTLLARFIGLISFSPNWGLRSTETYTNGLWQLSIYGLSLEHIIETGINQGCLVKSLPCVVDCLLMAKWDNGALSSDQFTRIVLLMRHAQQLAWKQDTTTSPCNSLFITMCVEDAVGQLVGLNNVPFHVSIDCDGGKFASSKDEPIDGRLDQTDLTSFYGQQKDIDELITLISRLNQASFSPLKSPGASRKLRPSRITQVSSPEMPSAADKKSLQGDVLKFGKDTIQAKLVHSFFHMHHDMKEVCEFVAKQIVSNTMRHEIGKCVRSHLNQHDLRPGNQTMVVDAVKKTCTAIIFDSVTRATHKALESLLTDKDDKVICAAVSIIVKQEMALIEPQISISIANEMEATKSSSKELFPVSELAPQCETVTSRWLLAAVALERLVHELSKVEPSETFASVKPASFIHASQAIEELASHTFIKTPQDGEIRSFFESVLTLDARFSHRILIWSTSSNGEHSEKWSILSSFLHLAASIKRRSRSKLRSLESLLSHEFLQKIIVLGLAGNSTPDVVASLLLVLLEKRMISMSHLKCVLQACEVADVVERVMELATRAGSPLSATFM